MSKSCPTRLLVFIQRRRKFHRQPQIRAHNREINTNSMATALTERPTAPSLAYDPDFEAYEQRKQRRLAEEQLPKDLPAGFPAQFETPSTWKGDQWNDESRFVYVFSKEDLADIDQALAHFKCTLYHVDSPRTHSRSHSAQPGTWACLSTHLSLEASQHAIATMLQRSLRRAWLRHPSWLPGRSIRSPRYGDCLHWGLILHRKPQRSTGSKWCHPYSRHRSLKDAYCRNARIYCRSSGVPY